MVTFTSSVQVSGFGCQQTDDGEQKTEDGKGASSSSFHHLSSTRLSSSQAVVWPLSSETRTLTPET
jgi:hypothetical protein